jgi:hypothetical protein
MGLAQPAVFAGGLDGRGGFDGFAERLDRDARRGRDVLASHAILGTALAGGLAYIHLPKSLILDLTSSG